MSYRYVWLAVVIGSYLSQWHVPTALAQAEVRAAARIIELKGQLWYDATGKVAIVYLSARCTDEDTESIDFAAFSSLKALVIPCPHVTNRGMMQICKVRQGLTDLIIHHARIDDNGILPFLRCHRDLRGLVLANVDIGDRTLQEVGEMDDLISLCINGTKASDAGLKSLVRLQSLVSFQLSGTQVTDVGVTVLAKLSRLGGLDLSNTAITDAGLRQLAALPRLRSVRVLGTRVTEEGKRALHELLPDLTFKTDD